MLKINYKIKPLNVIWNKKSLLETDLIPNGIFLFYLLKAISIWLRDFANRTNALYDNYYNNKKQYAI